MTTSYNPYEWKELKTANNDTLNMLLYDNEVVGQYISSPNIEDTEAKQIVMDAHIRIIERQLEFAKSFKI